MFEWPLVVHLGDKVGECHVSLSFLANVSTDCKSGVLASVKTSLGVYVSHVDLKEVKGYAKKEGYGKCVIKIKRMGRHVPT